MARVTFERVDKTYPNGSRALVDCNLEIADGELLAVVGPSGCGKSTLLRLVAGLETPTRGMLRIDGRLANDLRPQERNVAMVFQDYALYPHLTARGNLEFPLRMRGLSREERRQRVERVAALLAIETLLDRLPRELSGGQRQRVAMGRALVREPTVFLLDEPLSNLDAKLRGQVRAEIKELQQRTGTTMIYVTHDQVEAMTLGDRVAVLHQGRLQQVAAPREIYYHPANAFVAAFIGQPPMNLVPAKLLAGDGGAVVIIAGQHVPLGPRRAGLAAQAGVDVHVGIRPEALRVATVAEIREPTALCATVTRTESLGHETLLYAALRQQSSAEPLTVIARVPGMPELPRGSKVSLVMDIENVHLFGPDGRRLGTP